MKFADKYEILKTVTDGPVETFVANDIRRGYAVLVHIFDAGEQKPNQPTVQWVMEAFRSFAPEPAALVLEAGRYSGTLYAYLVTQVPEEAALHKWVERYRVLVQETQDEFVPLAAREPSRPEGTFTKVFKGSGSEAGPLPVANRPPQPSISPETHPLRMESVPPATAVESRIEYSREEAPKTQLIAVVPDRAGSSPDNSDAAEVAEEEIVPAIQENRIKPGEFTSFFHGPFVGTRPSELIAPTSPPPPSVGKVVGEFTATFGPALNSSADQASLVDGHESALNKDGPGEFTRSFVLDRPAKTQGDLGARITQTPSGSIGGTSQTREATARDYFPEPKPSTSPVLVAPAIPAKDSWPLVEEAAPSSPQGATKVLRMPGAGTEIVDPELPSCPPGEYTRIIAVPPREPVPSMVDAQTLPGSKPTAADASALPKLPTSFKPPALPTPPAPKLPTAPKLAPPAPPKLKPPKAPKLSTSYWPLILVLVVILVIAALLVGYFALKH
jgi:hypothetical protein